jgi:hypothetical protein
MITELRDITLFFLGGHPFVHLRCLLLPTMILDLMTSAYSNAPYTAENLYKILTLSSEIESQFITSQKKL